MLLNKPISPLRLVHTGVFLLVLVVFFCVLGLLVAFNWLEHDHEFKDQFLWFVSIISSIFVLLLSAYAYATLKHTRNIEQEIEKRVLAENQTRLFEAAVVHSQDGILISRVSGNRDEIMYVNEAFQIITGFSAEDVLGKSRRILWKHHRQPMEFISDAEYIESQSTSREMEFIRPDGRSIWLQRNMVLLRNDQNEVTHVITSKRDITNQVEYHRQLMEQKAKAEQLSRLKSDFLATMSHEIRTPMNGIIGMTGLLLDTELTQQQRGYVATINNSADSLLTIINDILDFSKIESGRLEFESIPFNLRSAAEDVLDLLTVRAREKGLELLLRYLPDTPSMVVGDPGRIRQILYNLIGNSIKFTAQGHVLVTAEVESCSTVEPTVQFRLSVTDTGIGIPEDKLNHIFDKFTQADSSTTRRFGGSGLGLAICKQLARMMHGEIGVESRLGEGSTFWFTVKLRLAENVPQESTVNHAILKGKRLLMVDDVAINHAIIEEQLQTVGIRTEFCLKGMDALRQLYEAEEKQDPFDFAIIDYLMPDINGEELARIIRRNSKLEHTKLIMLTAADERRFSKTLADAGFLSVLTKPLRQQMLIDTLALVCDPESSHIVSSGFLPHPTPKPMMLERKLYPGVRVLLAEDNMVNQQVAIQMLSKLECQVTAVANGQEVIDLLRDISFDVIFMDCQMPEMDGFEASRIIRTLIANGQVRPTPIIAITANAMQGDREKCLLAGMQDYIAKPLQSRDLEAMLNKWVVEASSKPASSPERSVCEFVHRHTFDALKEMMGTSFSSLLDNYLATTPTYMEQIRTAVSAQDAALLVKASHTLKSSSAYLGLEQLRSIASDLEHIGRNYKDVENWPDRALTLLEELQHAYGESVRWIKSQNPQSIVA